MTEEEWLACEDPNPMLAFMWDRVPDRRFWLFGVAAARQVWQRLHAGWRSNTELAERHADGNTTDNEKHQIESALPYAGGGALGGIHLTPDPWRFAVQCAGICQLHASWSLLEKDDSEGYQRSVALHAVIQATLVRDIFGNPFRPVAFDPAWRTDTATALARAMYDSREFSAMPILADALQDAGCDSADILNHCRGEGTHVRGCWVVDQVLGKE